jgi:H+-transporting ATPase
LNNEDARINIRQTDLDEGLKNEEVKKRLIEYGHNEVLEKKTSFWITLGKRFWGIVPWMLEATVILTLLLGKAIEALVIIALLLFNAGMSQWREGKAKAAITTLKQRLHIDSRVKRD